MVGPPPQPNFPPAQAPKNSGLALASLILGIGSFFTWILTGIPAIICGHIALGKIRDSGGSVGGKGMAITGLVLGYVTIPLIFIIAALAAMATPVILKQKQKADEVSATYDAGAISSYLFDYESTHGKFPDTLEDIEKSDPSFHLEDYSYRKGDWNYFGKGKDTSVPTDYILLSWQHQKSDRWVVLYADGRTIILEDPEYQAALRAQNAP